MLLLVEKRLIVDRVASGLGRVDLLNGRVARFVLYIENPLPDGSVEYEVCDKIILPMDAVPDAILMASHACAVTLIGSVKRLMPAVLH